MNFNFTISRKTAFTVFSLIAILLLPLIYSLGFIGDDHRIIFASLKNPFPFHSDWTGSNVHLYRPLTIITIFLNYFFSGTNPFPYYLVNLLIHLLSSFFIYNIFTLLDVKENNSLNPNLIFFITLLFLVIPQNLQNVFWISGRNDLLCGLFLFISIYYTIKYLASQGKIFIVPALACQILAFMSKESALLIVFYIPFLLLFRNDWLKSFIKEWRVTFSFALPTIFYLLYRFAIFSANPLGAAFKNNDSVSEVVRFYVYSAWILFIPFDVTDSAYFLNSGNIFLMAVLFLAVLTIILISIYLLFINRKSPAFKLFLWVLFASLISQVVYLKTWPAMRLVCSSSVFILACLFIILKLPARNRMQVNLFIIIYLLLIISGDALLVNRTFMINNYYKKLISVLPEKIDSTKLYYVAAPIGLIGQTWASPESGLMAQLKVYHNLDRSPENFINAGTYNGYSLSGPLKDLSVSSLDSSRFIFDVNNRVDYISPYATKKFQSNEEYIFPKMRLKLLTERKMGKASSCEMILEDPLNSVVIIVK